MSTLTELSLACDVHHSEDTFYFAFDPSSGLTQVPTPDFIPGENVTRPLLKSLYGNDVYFDVWYMRSKAMHALPVYAFTQNKQIYIVAVADRPGTSAQQSLADQLNPTIIKELTQELRARVPCQADATHGHCVQPDEQAPAYDPGAGADDLAPPDTGRVLVLTRRAPSTRLDHRSMVDGFRQVLHGHVETPALEFLTPGGTLGVQHNFKLTVDPEHKDFSRSQKFIDQHQGQFTAVVLHTCPFLFMLDVLPTIATLLRKDGKMLWTTRTDGPHSVELLPPETFARIIGQFNQQHGDKWHVHFSDFQVLTPGLFLRQ